MEIKERLKILKINKMLVVDDTQVNIDAAREYFDSLKISIDYSISQKEACEKLKEGYESNKIFDLTLTDMEMEEKKSGLVVVKAALNHGTFPFIVTGANYEKSDNDPHGPNTYIIPVNDKSSINGRKSKSDVWESVLELCIDSLLGENQYIYRSFKRWKDPSEDMVKQMMLKYGGK